MKYELPSFSVYLSTPEYAKGYEGISWADPPEPPAEPDAIAMLTRCFQSQTPGGIYRDLTEEERQGLTATDIVQPGRDYRHPERCLQAHRPIDEDLVHQERALLGLTD